MRTFLIKISPVLLILAFFGASCDDYLGENPDDRSNIDSSGNLQKLLVSAYPNASNTLLCELSSDNADENQGAAWTSYDLVQTESYLWKNSTQRNEDSPYYVWSQTYTAIGTACEVLRSIEDTGNPPSLNGVRAEALLCRAYGHFILANTFCQAYNPTRSNTDLGIPYVDKPEENLFVEYPRETLAKTYEKIAADIEAALPYIGEAVYSVPKYHFNKEAAYAFAARFYLYYRQYDKAIEYATVALGANPATKLRDWQGDREYRTTSERGGNRYISLEQSANFLLIPAKSLWGRIHGAFAVGSLYTYNSTIANSEATFSSTPWGSGMRYAHTNYMAQVSKIVVHKLHEFFEYVDPVAGIGFAHIVQPVFTADETLLTRAEAYALSGDLDNAAKDLIMFGNNFCATAVGRVVTKQSILNFYANMAYYQAMVPTAKKEFNIDFALTDDQENMLHAVLHLRRMLTMHEGFRWQDIKRYGIVIYRRKNFEGLIRVTDTMEKDDLRRAIQIPHLILSSGVEPNPQ